MRRRDHVWQAGEVGRGHLVGGAADVHGAAGDRARAQGLLERLLVDQVAARDVDEVRGALHPKKLVAADQVLGLRRGDGQTDHEVGFFQQRAEVGLAQRGRGLDVGIAHQDLHAERQAELGQAPADAAIADDAERAAEKLAAHDGCRRAARPIGAGRIRDAAGKVDHHADGKLGNRIDEARARPRHQHAGLRRGADVDVADVDGAAHEGHEVRQLREDFRGPFGLAVGDDHGAAGGELDHLCRRQRPTGLVQADRA